MKGLLLIALSAVILTFASYGIVDRFGLKETEASHITCANVAQEVFVKDFPHAIVTQSPCTLQAWRWDGQPLGRWTVESGFAVSQGQGGPALTPGQVANFQRTGNPFSVTPTPIATPAPTVTPLPIGTPTPGGNPCARPLVVERISACIASLEARIIALETGQ